MTGSMSMVLLLQILTTIGAAVMTGGLMIVLSCLTPPGLRGKPLSPWQTQIRRLAFRLLAPAMVFTAVSGIALLVLRGY